ncbi:MAG: cyclic nucleotide-binding domain-containing protein [Pseudomonadota bacterium]
MKTKDWAAIMRVHPVFAMLSEDQRTQLLQPDVSTEITYEKDDIIIRQGELGRSAFLLSDGSASVTMRRGGENEVELYSVGYGELFGEMALIEERPRAASVRANETSVVLEIDGVAFVELLKSEPEISFMLLGKLSRRLRFTNTKVMEQRISGLDETVNVMNSRIDSMMAKTQAHLDASKVIFEQTRQSANEVVEAGERKQALLTRVGTIGAVILTIAASFGFWDMKNTAASIDQQSAAIETKLTNVEAGVEAKSTEIEAELANLEKNSQELEEVSARAKAQVDLLEKQIDKARDLSDRANAAITATQQRVESFQGRIDAQFLLAELNQKLILTGSKTTLDFTPQQIKEIAELLQFYDDDEVFELGQILTDYLAQELNFHKSLSEALDNPDLTDPRGRVFLTYFNALSTIQVAANDELYSKYRRELYQFTTDTDARLKRAWLVTDTDRQLLQFTMTQSSEDDSDSARRVRKVDLLVDLMQQFSAREG